MCKLRGLDSVGSRYFMAPLAYFPQFHQEIHSPVLHKFCTETLLQVRATHMPEWQHQANRKRAPSRLVFNRLGMSAMGILERHKM